MTPTYSQHAQLNSKDYLVQQQKWFYILIINISDIF